MSSFTLSILFALGGVLSLWGAITFLRADEVRVPGGPFTRAAHPVRFWAYVVWLLLLGGLLLLLAVLTR